MSLIGKMGALVTFASGTLFAAQMAIAGGAEPMKPLVVLFTITLNLILRTRRLFLVRCMGRRLSPKVLVACLL